MFDFRGWLGIEYPWKSRDLCEGSAASDKVLDWKTRPPPGRCRGNFVFTVFKPAAICVELLSRSDRATNDLADRFLQGLFHYHHQGFVAIDIVIFINVTMTCITRWYTVAHWTPRWKDHPDERPPRWKTNPIKDLLVRRFLETLSLHISTFLNFWQRTIPLFQTILAGSLGWYDTRGSTLVVPTVTSVVVVVIMVAVVVPVVAAEVLSSGVTGQKAGNTLASVRHHYRRGTLNTTIWLKSVLFNLFCVFDLFFLQNAGSQLCFSFFFLQCFWKKFKNKNLIFVS